MLAVVPMVCIPSHASAQCLLISLNYHTGCALAPCPWVSACVDGQAGSSSLSPGKQMLRTQQDLHSRSHTLTWPYYVQLRWHRGHIAGIAIFFWYKQKMSFLLNAKSEVTIGGSHCTGVNTPSYSFFSFSFNCHIHVQDAHFASFTLLL